MPLFADGVCVKSMRQSIKTILQICNSLNSNLNKLFLKMLDSKFGEVLLYFCCAISSLLVGILIDIN